MKIGYIWQEEAADMDAAVAWPLHIRAVVGGLRRLGHAVRLITFRDGRISYTDDLAAWQPGRFGRSQSRAFRAVERPVRGIQSRLGLPYIRLFDSYRFADAAANALAGYDALYERYWLHNSGGLMAARRLGVPLVLEVNGDIWAEGAVTGRQFSAVQRRALEMIAGRILRGADHVVAVSEPLRQRLIERWRVPPERLTVVANGVDVERFTIDEATRQRYRAALGLNGAAVVAFVGSFEPWHGLDQVLDCFAAVARRSPAARLVLAGDGPLRPEMEARAEKLGLASRVTFTGRVSPGEVAGILSTADVAVLSPRPSAAMQAQSPLKLFEYMAAGRAIVAPDIPSIRGVVAHGESALLVPPGDLAGFADSIEALLADGQLRAGLGQGARERATARHSWLHTAEQIASIMSNLISR